MHDHEKVELHCVKYYILNLISEGGLFNPIQNETEPEAPVRKVAELIFIFYSHF